MLQLKKFPDIPVSTREEAREFCPHPEEPRFHILSREEGSFHCVRERIPGVAVAFQEEALSTGKARGTPGSGHHSKSPPDVSVHSRKNFFPCTASTFKPRIDTQWWHVGQPCGKASWESLVGKPRGKDTDPLIPAKGSVTLLLQLKRKAHVHVPTQDED